MDQDEQTGFEPPQTSPVDSISLPTQTIDSVDPGQVTSPVSETVDDAAASTDFSPAEVPGETISVGTTEEQPSEPEAPVNFEDNIAAQAEVSLPVETPVSSLTTETELIPQDGAGITVPAQSDTPTVPTELNVPEVPIEPTTSAMPEAEPSGVVQEVTPVIPPLQPFPVETPEPTPFEPNITGWNSQGDVGPAQQATVYTNPAPVQTGTANKVDIKRLAIIIGGGALGLGLIAAGIFFGYRLFIGSSNSRILNAAAKNIMKGKNMEVNFKVGVSGFSVDGSLYVDKDQDMKLKLNNDLLPLEAIYIKKTDTIYLKESGYGSEEDQSSNEYNEGKNLSKAIAKYGLKDMGIDSLDPTKNYFSANNIKYFKRQPDEKMNGQNLYRFELTSTDEDIKKATDEANAKIQEYFGGSITIKELKNKTTIWINKSDFNLFKVEGSTSVKYSYKTPDYSKCYSSRATSSYSSCDYDNLPQKETNQDLSFNWELNVKGGYKEDIALPKDAKIIDSVDLENFQEEANKTSNDTQKKANLRTIQVGLETYYADNRKYPAKLSDLVPTYLKSLPVNPNNDETIYTRTNDGYELKVKLQNPDTNSADEKDGYYKVGY